MIWIKSKLALISFLVVIAGILASGSYLYLKGGQDTERKVLIQQQQSYIETRKRIDESTRSTSSVDDALSRLRSRQEQRNSK